MSDDLATRFGSLSVGLFPSSNRRKNQLEAQNDDASTGEGDSGHAFAVWSNSDSTLISNFEVSWTVPPAPTGDNNDDTYHIYNGLGWSVIDANGNSASANLRPMLRWAKPETGGDACWTVASWYLGANSRCSTTPVKVTEGSSITGKITLTSSSSSEYDYKCFFTDSNGEIPGTQLYIYGGNAYTITMLGFEWSNLTDFTSDPIVASSIVIQTGSSYPTVKWTILPPPSVTDQITVTVYDSSSTNGKIEFGRSQTDSTNQDGTSA
jgi:hypothetical protein